MIDKRIRELVEQEQSDPLRRQAMLDLYASGDPTGDAERFLASVEWQETLRILGPLTGRTVVDVGAGTGAASYALAKSGAQVIAVEPETGDLGRAAIAEACAGLPVTVLSGVGEQLPVKSGAADIVYARQVLHHAANLTAMLTECARALRASGTMYAAREYVVRSERQRHQWMAAHEMLHEGERPYLPREYKAGFSASGLDLVRIYRGWELVTNKFPMARTEQDIRDYGRVRLEARFGTPGRWIGRIPGTGSAVRKISRGGLPGDVWSFLAVKPS